MESLSLQLAEEESPWNENEEVGGMKKGSCGSESWTLISCTNASTNSASRPCFTRTQRFCVAVAVLTCVGALCLAGGGWIKMNAENQLIMEPKLKGAIAAPLGRTVKQMNAENQLITEMNAENQLITETNRGIDVWKAFWSHYPRLLHPEAQRELARCGVPDVMRPALWANWLDIKGPKTNHLFFGPSVAASEAVSELPVQSRRNKFVVLLEAKLQKEQGERDVLDTDDKEEAISALEAWQRLFPSNKSQSSPIGWKPSSGDEMVPPTQAPSGVEEDFERTFPGCTAFNAMDGETRLFQVLAEWGSREEKIRYCQGMNYIAAVLMMVFHDDVSVVEAAQNLFGRLDVRDWYAEDGWLLRVDSIVMEGLIRDRLPRVQKVMRKYSLAVRTLTSRWFVPLFSITLEGEPLRHVWDVIIRDGVEAVFRIALAMIAQETEMLERCTDLSHVIMVMQDWRLKQSSGALIRTAYGPEFDGLCDGKNLAKRRFHAATFLARGQEPPLSDEKKKALLQRFPEPKD